MAHAGDTRDGGARADGQRGLKDLQRAAHQHHDHAEIEADLIRNEQAADLPGYLEVLLQQHQQQEEHRAEQQEMGVDEPQRRRTLEPVELGELPIEDAAREREDGIDDG